MPVDLDTGALVQRSKRAAPLWRRVWDGFLDWKLAKTADPAFQAWAARTPLVRRLVRHHALFYRDMAVPVALLRGNTRPERADYWAYVAGGDVPEAEAAQYSRLMATSQAMVAAEVLGSGSLPNHGTVMDVGGGTGAFLTAALRATPGLKGILFDLPTVVEGAPKHLENAGLSERIQIAPGSFRTDALPKGADLISLIRVLYDHDDGVVRQILAAVFEALPSGGKVILSEPMSGGRHPSRSGDAYFGVYTLAMTTGRPRSPERHHALLEEAGFQRARLLPACQPHITRTITAVKPNILKAI